MDELEKKGIADPDKTFLAQEDIRMRRLTAGVLMPSGAHRRAHEEHICREANGTNRACRSLVLNGQTCGRNCAVEADRKVYEAKAMQAQEALIRAQHQFVLE
jgi:hypothetical protein